MADVVLLALPLLGVAVLTVAAVLVSRRLRARPTAVRALPLLGWVVGVVALLVLLSSGT